MKTTQRRQDIKALTASQRDEELTKLRKELFNLRFRRATNQTDNLAKKSDVRRDIARILTFQTMSKNAAEKV